MQADGSGSASRWIACRRWIQIILLTAVAAWWAMMDSAMGTGFVARMSQSLARLDPSFAKAILFWALPIGAVAAVQLSCYSLDRIFLERRWTPTDLLRLTIWRTVSPTVAILCLAAGSDAIYDRQPVGILYLAVAAILSVLGMRLLRSAEGMKMVEVKGGELYKRAFALAKVTKTPLRRVFVVPAGRGHLTNAYGASDRIAVTDNYGKFLSSAQLDFVIGHELEHAKAKHGRKKLLITASVTAGIALASFIISPFLSPLRPLWDILVIFTPILTFYWLSRYFEYAADAASVRLTKDPETAIRALVNLHRTTESPLRFNKVTELFMTHPSLTRRASAIAGTGGIPLDRACEAVEENSPQGQLRGRVSQNTKSF
jgi:Zn-dependent protease with chaperone function